MNNKDTNLVLTFRNCGHTTVQSRQRKERKKRRLELSQKPQDDSSRAWNQMTEASDTGTDCTPVKTEATLRVVSAVSPQRHDPMAVEGRKEHFLPDFPPHALFPNSWLFTPRTPLWLSRDDLHVGVQAIHRTDLAEAYIRPKAEQVPWSKDWIDRFPGAGLLIVEYDPTFAADAWTYEGRKV